MHLRISRVFNQLFLGRFKTRIEGGFDEPFYKAPKQTTCGVICYREDFASSALHEIAHWCVAGSERRKLDDFGYWYSPDGRSEEQQIEFEKVEVKPQALEWLFSLAAGIRFSPSADNLDGNCAPSDEFVESIRYQAELYLNGDIPERAATFVKGLQKEFKTPKLSVEQLQTST